VIAALFPYHLISKWRSAGSRYGESHRLAYHDRARGTLDRIGDEEHGNDYGQCCERSTNDRGMRFHRISGLMAETLTDFRRKCNPILFVISFSYAILL